MKVSKCTLIAPFTCHEDDPVVAVAKKLRGTKLRHIFVVTSHNHPVGIISVIDIVNRVVAEGRDPLKTKAKEIMSKPIDILTVDDDAHDVSQRLISKNHVLAPVMRGNEFIGIATLHQLLKCAHASDGGVRHG